MSVDPEPVRARGAANLGRFFAAADRISRATRAGPSGGSGSGECRVWHTMYTGYATQFWSYGATDFDESGRCAIRIGAGVTATEDFVRALRGSGPTAWPEQRWYELALDFAKRQVRPPGRLGSLRGLLRGREQSSLVGEIGYAPPPEGPTG